MPIKCFVSNKVSKRREISRQLFEIGLSYEDISKILNISKGQSRYDARHIFPEGIDFLGKNSKKRQHESYCKALKIIAEKIYFRSENNQDYLLPQVEKYLRKYTEFDNLILIVSGIIEAVKNLYCPEEKPEYKQYRDLMDSIYGGKRYFDFTSEYFLCEYILETENLPNRNEIVSEISRRIISIFRNDFLQPFNEDSIELIKYFLDKNLNERERKIIEKRFGLDCNKMTLEDIGKEFGVTKQRIRQIETNILRKLKLKSRILGFLYKSADELFSKYTKQILIDIGEQIESKKIEIKIGDILSMSIEEADFSTRTYRCLNRAGILKISDLVQKKENELMWIRNFGVGCLKEIKKFLDNYNLCLGMIKNEDDSLSYPENYQSHLNF